MGVSLYRADYGIIFAMDRAFRSEYPKTLQYHEARREHVRKMNGGK